MQDVMSARLMGERGPQQGMGAISTRHANHADRAIEQSRDRVNWEREWTHPPVVLEHGERRKLLEDRGEPRHRPPGRVQERPVEVGDYREEAVKLRVDLVDPVVEDRTAYALQDPRRARERPQDMVEVLLQRVDVSRPIHQRQPGDSWIDRGANRVRCGRIPLPRHVWWA